MPRRCLLLLVIAVLAIIVRVIVGISSDELSRPVFETASGDPFLLSHLLDTIAGASVAVAVFLTGFLLATKIVLSLMLGLAFGLYANVAGIDASVLKPVGDMFLKLITMIVVPLVFSSLLVGVASLGDLNKLARFGSKTIAYYLMTTCIAVTIGLLVANIVQPGSNIDPETRQRIASKFKAEADEKMAKSAEGKALEEETAKGKSKPANAGAPAPSGEGQPAPPALAQKDKSVFGILGRLVARLIDTLVNIVPKNPLKALIEGEMLQIIFFALFLGLCLTMLPEDKSRPFIAFFDSLSDAMLKMVQVVMLIAPYGVFALIASVVSQFGADVLQALLTYSLVVLAGLTIHLVVVYPSAVFLLARRSPARFLRGIAPAWSVAFSTSSSNATLPVTMRTVENRLGVPERVSSFVLPLGATINMDGTALYQGVAAFFIFQVYGIPLDLGDQLVIVMTATLASIGTAGVPGVGIVMLILVLQSVGLGADKIGEGIALILGVDRLLDMCRTVVNVTGDASCAVIVAKTEGELGEGYMPGDPVPPPEIEAPIVR